MATLSKRRTERVFCNLTVRWMRRGVATPAVAADVNLHGLFIRTGLEAQPGELLQLVIDLPDGPMQVCVTAQFVGLSQSGRGIGAEIFAVSDVDRRRWTHHYRQLLRDALHAAQPLSLAV